MLWVNTCKMSILCCWLHSSRKVWSLLHDEFADGTDRSLVCLGRTLRGQVHHSLMRSKDITGCLLILLLNGKLAISRMAGPPDRSTTDKGLICMSQHFCEVHLELRGYS